MSREYGHVPGIDPGAKFKTRDEVMKAGLHGALQAGIHGDPEKGAFSICLSGGYEDNNDMGDKIIYVGSGGQNMHGDQVANQSLEDPPNQSLYKSFQTKLPVRVIRGRSENSYYAPGSGFRYDGLYVVDSVEMRKGKKGFKMCFFELRRIREEGDGPLPTRRLLTSGKLAKMDRNALKK